MVLNCDPGLPVRTGIERLEGEYSQAPSSMFHLCTMIHDDEC